MSELLLFSLGTTPGLRAADADLLRLLERTGADVVPATMRIGATRRLQRFYPAIDLVAAAAARRGARTAIARHRPRAVILSTTTAAMLAPLGDLPYAVRLDSPAALNRPGRHNAPLHVLERRRLAAARLVLPMSSAAAAALPRGSAPHVVVPMTIAPSGSHAPRERRAVAYVPDPKAKGLELLAGAWAQADVPGATLDVFGIGAERGHAFLARFGRRAPDTLRWRGMVARDEFRAALRRARVHITSARWEDWGQAQLEALADGALLATTPAGGAFEALALARALDARLVAARIDVPSLARAIRAAFALDDGEAEAYRRRAAELLRPFREEAVLATLTRDVLPRLLTAGC